MLYEYVIITRVWRGTRDTGRRDAEGSSSNSEEHPHNIHQRQSTHGSIKNTYTWVKALKRQQRTLAHCFLVVSAPAAAVHNKWASRPKPVQHHSCACVCLHETARKLRPFHFRTGTMSAIAETKFAQTKQTVVINTSVCSIG